MYLPKYHEFDKYSALETYSIHTTTNILMAIIQFSNIFMLLKLSKSRALCSENTVKPELTRPPIYNGHFFGSQGWTSYTRLTVAVFLQTRDILQYRQSYEETVYGVTKAFEQCFSTIFCLAAPLVSYINISQLF